YDNIIIGSNIDISNDTNVQDFLKPNNGMDKPPFHPHEIIENPINSIPKKQSIIEFEDLEKASLGNGNGSLTIQPFSATSTPNDIKLYITSSSTLVDIGFDDYAKQVLPNEWIASWEQKSLQAGAIAI